MKHVFGIVLLACVVSACGGDDDDGPNQAMGAARATGRVTSVATGAGIAGVDVRAGNATTTTDADGGYTLDGITAGSSVLLSFTKTGYVPQSRSTLALAATDASTIVNVPMLEVKVTEEFDSHTAHTIVVPGSSARVDLAANALRRADGADVVGMATAYVTPIAPANDVEVMPGNYLAQRDSGSAAMESFGALDASFVDESGAALNLGGGATSTVRIAPSSRSGSLPSTIPLFYYDTGSGLWVEQGSATLVGFGADAYYEGTVSHFTTWNADRVYDTVLIRGCVQDSTGNRVAGAVVKSEGKNYTGQASALTNANGEFSVPAMMYGAAYVVAATADGIQVSNASQLSLGGSDEDMGEPCLTLTEAALSVKLTWGPSPSDLDSHTLGANVDEHIYYASRGDFAAAPFLALDVDDTSGYGPEVTTFARLAKNRTYRYFVDNYSGTSEPGQTGSPARVDVTLSGRRTVFTPPSGETTETMIWHVFDLTTDGNCKATIVPVQAFSEDEPLPIATDNAAEFCN